MSGLTRRATLAGAVAAAVALPRAAQAQVGAGDPALLNLSLALDYLAAELYGRAPDVDGLSRRERALARSLARDEGEHVEALLDLIGKLGGRPIERPRLNPEALRSGEAFLRAAQTLEDAGLALLNHSGVRLQDPTVLALAGGLANVEARHAAAVRDLRGEDPSPDAFDRPLRPDAVRRRVEGLVR